jgi:hypothetical protein
MTAAQRVADLTLVSLAVLLRVTVADSHAPLFDWSATTGF